ncbi:MAG: hypothetical protein V3T72_06650 [Thermoanaerobaculia bacterium]
MDQVRLQPGLPGGRWACLRGLCGHDEAAVDGTSDLAAAALLERLLVEAPGTTVSPATVWELTVCDRDRLLAAVYRRHFGDRIEGDLTCRGCGERFEATFSLAELLASLEADAGRSETGNGHRVTGPDEDGVYRLADAGRFRLPTLGDQRRAAGLDPAAARRMLLERCVVEGDPSAAADDLDAAMAAVGPVVDLDLDAACSECDEEQSVRFDIRSYLLAALAREKRWLIREVHYLATAYGWSLDEILGLPRDDRRAFVRLIEAERGAEAPR